MRLGGEQWVVGANDLAHALRWVVWFAVLGGLVMMLSVWARTAADLTRQAQTMTPIDALFSTRATAPRVLAARMLLPTGTATIIGTVHVLPTRLCARSLVRNVWTSPTADWKVVYGPHAGASRAIREYPDSAVS